MISLPCLGRGESPASAFLSLSSSVPAPALASWDPNAATHSGGFETGLTGHQSVWGTGGVLKSCPGAALMPGAAAFLPKTNSQGFVVPLRGFA